jgi:MarR family 2-MHQ and catechol resistance regulon transcriptional repressor
MNRSSAAPRPTKTRRTQVASRAPRSASEEAALKLWVVLSRAHAAIAKHAAADIARHGVTPTEFAILEALYHLGPLLLGEVQQKILVSSGGVTYLVDRLERRGLVKRQECAEDRRARYAALTAEGEKLISRIFPEHARHIARAVSGLTSAERAQATALLRTLGTAAGELSLPGER